MASTLGAFAIQGCGDEAASAVDAVFHSERRAARANGAPPPRQVTCRRRPAGRETFTCTVTYTDGRARLCDVSAAGRVACRPGRNAPPDSIEITP